MSGKHQWRRRRSSDDYWTVLEPSLSGAPASAAGVTVRAFLNSGGPSIASTITDGSGKFSLSLPTGGTPFDGYLYMSGSNLLKAAAYWSKPLTSGTTTAPFMLNSSQEDLLYQQAGFSNNNPARVRSLFGSPIAKARLLVTPGLRSAPAFRLPPKALASTSAVPTSGCSMNQMAP